MISIVNVRLPTGDTPVASVLLEPYVLVKRGDAVTSAEDLPSEGDPPGASPWLLRSRWFRSSLPRGGAVCGVHPEREAALQCTVCLRARAPQHLSYHCSPACFRSSWHAHLEYHRAAAANPSPENGYDSAAAANKAGSLSTGGETWVEVSRERCYTPASEDVGFVLKYECAIVDAARAFEACRPGVAFSARVRPAPNLPARALVPLPGAGPSGGGAAGGRFTLLTYNVLADLYAKADGHSQCPAWVLAWPYRRQNLLRELLARRPDVMCLQEVQSDHYNEWLLPELTKAGYLGIYKKKTAEVFTGAAYATDGCATFFRRDRFALVKKYEVEFNKAAVSLAETMASAGQKKATMNRLLKDNVALIAVLEAADAGGPAGGGAGAPGADGAPRGKQLICVANTHIHANPELSDVKLWQVHTLLKGLEKIANSADIPMLVAGDFNSAPGSAAHALLVRGRVDPSQLDPSMDPLHLLRDQKLQHALPLASAYAALWEQPPTSEALRRQRARLDPVHHEPLFTNATRDFKGTLDYILYTRDSLAPRALLELPSEADLGGRPGEGLPNANWSSDHIALMAEFSLVGGGGGGAG